MKISQVFARRAAGGDRVDWKTEREKIDLAAVVTNRLGPAPGRRGERSSRRLWWNCPFHSDANPSFCVEVGKPWWRCRGCDEHGDAATLLIKLDGVSFPEAIATLTGQTSAPRRPPSKAPSRPVAPPTPKPSPDPSGLPEDDALALVDDAERRLWAPEGKQALAHLTGDRSLTRETIKARRLGWTDGVSVPKSDGTGAYSAAGWTVPWSHEGRLALVKIRQPENRSPKYVEVHRTPTRLVCYPCLALVRPGRPVIITEGEFDAILLAQELAALDVTVLTLGSASARPATRLFEALFACPAWYLATDADDAGDKAAEAWPARAKRVRPPGPGKDWTDAHAGGPNRLRYYWAGWLGRGAKWADLEHLRWGDDRPDLDLDEDTSA
jgi:DNA primase